MLIYFLKSSICLALLLAIYHLFLEKEKMHEFNRFYLLGSIMFSFLAPSYVIYIEPIQTFEPIYNTVSALQPLEITSNLNSLELTSIKSINYDFYFKVLYLIIVSLFVFRFVKNLLQITAKIRKNQKISYKNATVVLMSEKVIPHTFLNFIFINKKAFKSNKIEDELFTHELTHVNQKHTIDILVVEILQIICWFNPLLIYLKNAIKLNHEFIADQNVIKYHKNIFEYQHLLLSKVTQNYNSYLVSNFNYSLTKKRLIMMTKKSSHLKMLFKKIAIIPVAIGFTVLFANRVEAQEKTVNTKTQKVQEKVTDEIISEYNTMAKKLNNKENVIIKNSEYKRLYFIYNSLSEDQKRNVEKFPAIPPPPPKKVKAKELLPPPPPPSNASPEQLEQYKEATEKYNNFRKEEIIKKGEKSSIPPPPIPPNATLEQKEKYKKVINDYNKDVKTKNETNQKTRK